METENSNITEVLEKSIIVSAHPDDEILWFSSILDKVDEVVICFLNSKSKPHWSIGRKKSLSEHPIKNISCLEIDESEAFWHADWQKPVITNFGLEINDYVSRKRYKENYYELKQRLANKLIGYYNVFTNNPWGEYGHVEHVQIYRVIKELQEEIKFNLWFPNYCSNKSFKLMLKYVYGLDFEFKTFKTNKVLANSIKDLYKKNGCWTWYDDWEWLDEESFMKDKTLEERTENFGNIFPLNFITVEPIKPKRRTESIKIFLKKYAFFHYTIIPFVKLIRRKVRDTGMMLYKVRYTISRKEFVDDLKTAIEKNIGYATGKNGNSQQYWNYYEIFLKKEMDRDKIRQYEEKFEHHFLKNTGIFPCTPDFILKYSKFYIAHVRNLDCLGVFPEVCYPRELEMIKYYKLKNKLTHYRNQEPDRSSPSNEKNCYLQYFQDKKILLICPFAGLLKERATKEIFEGVWSKTGKKWFYPKSVDALEFPYGFSPETHKKYPTALDLFEHITTEIDKKDFDIALIAAAGLAIPIASYVKSIGKIGIDLGGHLQVLFGVLGERWRRWGEPWKKKYITDWWIDMPVKYRPKETDVCDKGAYW